MDATKLPKQKSGESNTDGRPKNLPGIYVHKDTGARYITSNGEEGTIQADALLSPIWEHAWEWTAEVPSRQEILEMQKAQLKKDAVIIEAPVKAEAKVSDNPPPGTGASY